MFTGIITNLGEILKKTEKVLRIKAETKLLKKLEKGMSIAINGICLTVVRIKKEYFEVDFIPETDNRTNIEYLDEGSLVNLELPATASSFLSGHIVQGHIDGISKLMSIKKKGNSYTLKFFISSALFKYIVEKGSIAVSGISLTVSEVQNNHFTVDIIPFTWKETMLHTLKIGDFVNIEVDILAKYLKSLLKKED